MVRTRATERANLTETQEKIKRLRLIVQKLQRSQFGRRAERLDDDQLQLSFEDLHADIARDEATLPSTTVKTPRSRTDRPSLPAHLPREDIRLDPEHQACPCCGGELHVIGETVSEMLDHLPARLRVIRICRPRYGCRACGTIHQPAPERPIGRGWPVLLCSARSCAGSPNTAITFHSTGRARSSPGMASRSTARRSPTGSVVPAGGWSCQRNRVTLPSRPQYMARLTDLIESPCAVCFAPPPNPGSSQMTAGSARL